METVTRLGCFFRLTCYSDIVEAPAGAAAVETNAEYVARIGAMLMESVRQEELEKIQIMEDVRAIQGEAAAAALQAKRDELMKPRFKMGVNYHQLCSTDIAEECMRGVRSGRGVPEFAPQLAKCHSPGLSLGQLKYGGKAGDKTIQEVVIYESVISDY